MKLSEESCGKKVVGQEQVSNIAISIALSRAGKRFVWPIGIVSYSQTKCKPQRYRDIELDGRLSLWSNDLYGS
jgi:hypothetical protein